MCYNDLKGVNQPEKCSVNIISSGDGWSENKTSEGEIFYNGGKTSIRYLLDGDECVLTVCNGEVTQTRRGGQNVSISFKQGKNTDCTISNGGFSGSFEIFTNKLKFENLSGGVKLALEYISGDETISLTFSAIKLQELK